MSFYNDASLIMLPSAGAGKDGKAYSVKPTDGTGDFTFSRGSNLAATRVNASGLIEKGRENLLLQSNQFDTTWAPLSATLTANQSGYDGSSDAWILESTGIAYTRVSQSISLSGVVNVSIYVKYINADYLAIEFSSSIAYFNINPSTLGNRLGYTSSIIDTEITELGSDWFRCSLTFNASTTSTIRFYVTDANNNKASSVGSSIYIQDSQLEIGLAATDYIESGASTGKAGLLEDEPRFDYSGGATCPSLLLEPSRTNEVSSSEYISGSNTNTIFTFMNPVTEYGQSPEGLQNAALISASQSYGHIRYVVTTEKTYTASVFVKSAGQLFYPRFRTSDNLYDLQYEITADNTISLDSTNLPSGDYGYDEYNDGWYRIWAKLYVNPSQNIQYWPDTSNNVSQSYVYGFQIEQDATYPTSYIPTYGSSVTRNSESSGVTNASEIICQNEGTLFVDFKFKQGSQTRFSISSGNASNWIFLGIPDSSRSSRVYIKTNNVIYVDEGVSNFFVDGERYKVCLSYKSGKWSLVSNGVIQLSGTETFANPSSEFSSLLITGGGTSISDAYTKINYNQALIFPTALSDADCITLTTI